MKATLHIDASLERPDLLEYMVEQLANKKEDKIPASFFAMNEWRAIDTSSTETYASGTFVYDDETNEQLNIPFITRFIFTCTRLKGGDFKLDWSSSFN